MAWFKAFTQEDLNVSIIKNKEGQQLWGTNIPNADAAAKILELTPAQRRELEREGSITIDYNGIATIISAGNDGYYPDNDVIR